MITSAAQFYPAAERNKAPICSVLVELVQRNDLVVEVASGTGQQVAYFASRCDASAVWQPSDINNALFPSIAAHATDAALENIRPPITINVLQPPWACERPDLVLAVNLLHVAPEAAMAGLFQGAEGARAVLIYGPFSDNGVHNSVGNEQFDASLRAQDPRFGIRSIEEVSDAATVAGFVLASEISMPANNRFLIYQSSIISN